MLFEISFLFLLLGRRLRYAAAILGLGFHGMTGWVMNIHFESLRNCYVIFAPWGQIAERIAPFGRHKLAALPQLHIPEARAAAVIAIGAMLVMGSAAAGARRIVDGWPFACYPPFDGLANDHLRTLQIQATLADGSVRIIQADDYRDTFGNRWNNLLQRILENRDRQRRDRQLSAVWGVLAGGAPWGAEARRVRFVTARTYVDPSRWRERPDDPMVLLDVPIHPARAGRP